MGTYRAKIRVYMYYKISSLVLNAGKHQNGSRDVYIAQPDAIKENLAGKLFLLAEIDGKKTDAKKVIDFIIASLDDFYYNDEKIFLQDKIEGLSLDNIFEAALAKLNKALLEFVSLERIPLRAEDTNLVLGLVFENKLLFSNFGRNKAFLIYKRQEQYELINVEASAADLESAEELPGPVVPKFFASVISGEIPNASYFLFCNEALPEYLSNKDLINVVTKLPPMVAAEQIKGALSKLNSYVPFLGIIIKNTFGLSGLELKDDSLIESNQSAHNSISNLNYTEKKTEQMLAPAGLVNWQKIGKIWRSLHSKIGSTEVPLRLKNQLPVNKNLPSLSKQKTLSAARMIKEKMSFGRKHVRFGHSLKIVFSVFINLFNPIFWKEIWQKNRTWISALNPRNKAMFTLLVVALLILLGSLVITGINNRQRANTEYFNNLMAGLEAKKSMVDSYLLYDNQEGAKTLIGESLAALDSLPVKGEEQIARRDQIRAEVEQQRARVQKLSTIDNPELLVNLKDYNTSAETRNLIFVKDKLYAADSAAKAVYSWDLNAKKSDSFLLSGDFNSLEKPVVLLDKIYYLSGNRLISLDITNGNNSALNLDGIGPDDKINAFQLYLDRLYILMADNNQIYRLNRSGNNFTAKTSWLKEEVQLGDAIDLAVTGDVLVLKNGGQLQKFYLNRPQDFSLAAVDPALDSASLLKASGDRFFILDKNSKRLLIFNKEGSLLKQFRLPSLNNLKDFSIATDNKTAYFLNDDAVYKIDLE